MWHYKAVVKRIIDADTIDLSICLGFHLTADIRVRVARIDAWETRGKERPEGLLAKSRVEELCPVGATVEVTTGKTGKYGRWIGEIQLTDGRNLSDLLVEEGHAEFVQY